MKITEVLLQAIKAYLTHSLAETMTMTTPTLYNATVWFRVDKRTPSIQGSHRKFKAVVTGMEHVESEQ